MSANTTPDNITYAISTDSISPLETVFANLASSVQNALNYRQIKSYKWANATARGAQAGMGAGDVGDQADTLTTYRYSGSTWVANARVVGGLISGVSTDTVGNYTVSHSLGVVPTSIVVTGAVGSTIPERLTYNAYTPTSSGFVVRVYRQDTGVLFASNAISFYWMAFA